MEILNSKIRFTLSATHVERDDLRPLLRIETVDPETKITPEILDKMSKLEDSVIEKKLLKIRNKYNLSDGDFELVYRLIKIISGMTAESLIKDSNLNTLLGQCANLNLPPLFQTQNEHTLESVIPRPEHRISEGIPTFYELCMYVISKQMVRLSFTKIADEMLCMVLEEK